MVQAPHLRNKQSRSESQPTAEHGPREQRRVSLPKRRALLALERRAQTKGQASKQSKRKRVFRSVVLGVRLLFWFAMAVVVSFMLWMVELRPHVNKRWKR